MSCDRYARMIIKRGQGPATVPPSADHRNGDWIETDIYEGELYMDTDTGIVYIRSNGTIITVDGPTAKTYEALLSQSGTSNPTVIENENTIGAIVWTRQNTGHYRGTLTGAFTNHKVHAFIQSTSEDEICFVERNNDNSIDVYTCNKSLVRTDSLLNDTAIRIKIYQ
jgi:hypothetical protein